MLKTALTLEIPGRTILDVGCGFGVFSELLLNEEFHVIGLDLEMKTLKIVWDKLKEKNHFQLVRADAQHLPFRPESFDLIVGAEVVEHLCNPAMFLKDVSTCLKINGTLLVSTPNVIGIWNLLFDVISRNMQKCIHKLLKTSYRYQSGHITLFTYTSLVNLLWRFNFVISRDLERWRIEGQLISISLAESFQRYYGVDIHRYVIFNVFKNIEFKVSRVLPRQLQSGWLLLCRRNTK
jgi:SAM-dependent methyltransferase